VPIRENREAREDLARARGWRHQIDINDLIMKNGWTDTADNA
jgi:hypothetical protein